MQSKPFTLYFNQSIWRSVAAISVFTILTVLSAKIAIYLPFTPVPITLQTLAVVLSGLVLGAQGGALAQVGYLGLIAVGLPVDVNGLGPAAFVGPTAGYLIGFVPAAFAAGWLAERFARQSWWGNFVAAVTGALVIYVVGATWLAVLLGSWQTAWTAGVVPFILVDLGKAAVAAGVAESGKRLFANQP